jgi:hypothetical protein
MKFFKKNFILILAVLFLMSVFHVSFAAGDASATVTKIINPIGETETIEAFLALVLVAAFKIGSPIVVLAVIYSGFLFVKAQGNPEEITKAKDALMYSLIGAAILLGAQAIAQIITSTITTLSV